MVARLWNQLHDGVIERIDGSVPGDIRLFTSVLYLRELFEGKGEGFVFHLSDCSIFEFTLWDSAPTTDLGQIEGAGIEVLSAEDGDPVKVCCAEGMLRVRYRSAGLRLDSGAAVSLDELEAAATRYWDRFEARHRGVQGAG